MNSVPHSVFEAAVRVAGETLYWKRSLRRVLRTSGVSESAVNRHYHETKYVIMRGIWAELDNAGQRGLKVQRTIIAALSNLDRPEEQADQRAGNAALADLKRLSKEHRLLVDPEELAKTQRRHQAKLDAESGAARRDRQASLLDAFHALHRESNTQQRGYAFERLIADLFRLHELDFRGSYKSDTDQIDGALTFESFTYLVEARWRKEAAVDADLAVLDGKVRRRLDATRGMFISMAGYRPEVVDLYRRARDQRLVLVDGQDLALILEGRVELIDALHAKVRAASVEGEPFLPLATLV